MSFFLMLKSSRRRPDRGPLLVSAAVLAVVGLIVIFAGPLRGVAGVTSFSSALGGAARFVFGSFADAAACTADLKTLETLAAAREAEIAVLAAVETENRELRTMLDAALPEGVVGEVVSWPPVMPFDRLLVRVRGEIQDNALVLGHAGAPIGVVEAVDAGFARVKLFSSPDATTSVWVGEEGALAEARGEGGGSLAIALPEDAAGAVGDPVFYPYRGGTRLGTVAHVEELPKEGVRILRVSLPLHPFAEGWVKLLPGEEAPESLLHDE